MSIEKIDTGDTLSMSKDLVNDNIEKLKSLFPEIVTEGKIDFKVLQKVLGEEVEEGDEYYRLTWAGKSKARREAHKPSTGTLRPAKEESVNWDKTENLYIEGDNLEVLKLMQKTYAGKVKMIYIDPPYNTGNDFVYIDDYKDNLKNYQQLTGQKDEKGNRLTTNSESTGHYHSNWLNMMYPRLILARNLLTEDGVIFTSIDDHEVENLKKLKIEIFGEQQFEAQVIPIVNPGGRDYRQIAVTNEHLLIFSKSPQTILKEIPKETNFKYFDSQGGYILRELRNRNPKFHSGNRPNLFYPFYVNSKVDKNGYCTVSLKQDQEHTIEVRPYNSKGKESVWRWGQDKAKKNIALNDFDQSQILAKQKKDGNWNIYEKNRRDTTKVKSVWGETEMRTENGTRTIRKLFDETVFDHPKPIDLIKRCVQIGSEKNDIILDFFSGSSSSAHAILDLNLEEGANRRFIQIQLPQRVSKDSIAGKNGYQTLTDLGKERIRRAAKEIAKENPEKAKHLDLGFKVFKLDSSNIQAWNGNPENLEESLFSAQESIKTDRSELDVLYEILLKYGLDLTLPIEEKQIAGQRVFNVGMGALFICLSDKITTKVAEGIGDWKEELKPGMCRVIFKDSGFNDVEKTNCSQILKAYGIEEVKSI